MKVKDIEKGMLVTITDGHHTKEAFGWGDKMSNYTGTVKTVKCIKPNKAINLTECSSDGFDFNWSAEDLSVAVIPTKKIQRFNFNIKNLDV